MSTLIWLLTYYGRCDRKTPCSACVRHDVHCVFNPSPPPRNKHRRPNMQILTDRLKHYEALLREKGVDPIELQHIPGSETRRRSKHTEVVEASDLQWDAAPPVESESRQSVNRRRVIQGEGCSKFIDKWVI